MAKVNNIKLHNNLEIQLVDNQDYIINNSFQTEESQVDELVQLIYDASDPTIKEVTVGNKNGQDIKIKTSGLYQNNKLYQVTATEDERVKMMKLSHILDKGIENNASNIATMKDNDSAVVDNASFVASAIDKSNVFLNERIRAFTTDNEAYQKVKKVMANDKFLHAVEDANNKLKSTIMASKEFIPENLNTAPELKDSNGIDLVGNFGFNTNVMAFQPDMSPAVPVNSMSTLIPSLFPIETYLRKVPLSGLNRYSTQINRVDYGASISNVNSSIQGDADDTALTYNFRTANVSSQFYQLSYTINGQIMPANDAMILSHNPDLLKQLYNIGMNQALYLRDYFQTAWFQSIDKFGDVNFGMKGLFNHPATKILEYEVEFEANGYTLKPSSILAVFEDISRITNMHPLLHISQTMKTGSIICDQKFKRALLGIYTDKTWLSSSIGGFLKIIGNTIAGDMNDSFRPHISMDMLISKDIGGVSAKPYFGTAPSSGKAVRHMFMFQTDPLKEFYESLLPNFANWEEFASNPLLAPFVDEPMGKTRLAITDFTTGQRSGTTTKLIDIAKKGGYYDLLGNRQWIILLTDKNATR